MVRPRQGWWDEAQKLYNGGMSYADIAARLDVTRATVRAALKPEVRIQASKRYQERKAREAIKPKVERKRDPDLAKIKDPQQYIDRLIFKALGLPPLELRIGRLDAHQDE